VAAGFTTVASHRWRHRVGGGSKEIDGRGVATAAEGSVELLSSTPGDPLDVGVLERKRGLLVAGAQLGCLSQQLASALAVTAGAATPASPSKAVAINGTEPAARASSST
jgi:hypothetical protein